MTDPISILLIIGAAVVGPVDAQCSIAGHVRPCALESISELCERVMREVGAEHRPTGVAQWYLLGGREIYCIPTPAGYRR